MKMVGDSMEYKYSECVYLHNENEVMDYFQGKENALFIMGCGFDPRMNVGISKLKDLVVGLDTLVLHYGRNNNAKSKENNKISNNNLAELKKVCGRINEETIERFQSGDDKTDIAYLSIKRKINKEEIRKYKHIIIDISAMPRTISFSLIEHIESIKDKKQKIFILVCENSQYDDKIEEVAARSAAQYLMCFNLFSMGRQALKENTTVWIPVMGDNEIAAFQKIAELIRAQEICPVIPFPAVDIRRGEKIIRKYGDYLFKNLKIEKRNIIYVPEREPMLIYTKLIETIMFYEKALKIFGEDETRYVFSSQSSKLMDVGILLTLLDLKKRGMMVTMAYVENAGYASIGTYNPESNHLSCVCLDEQEFEW